MSFFGRYIKKTIGLRLAMSECPSKRSSKTVQEVIQQQSHLCQYQSFDNSGHYLILTYESFHNLIYTRDLGSLRTELLLVLEEDGLGSIFGGNTFRKEEWMGFRANN